MLPRPHAEVICWSPGACGSMERPISLPRGVRPDLLLKLSLLFQIAVWNSRWSRLHCNTECYWGSYFGATKTA